MKKKILLISPQPFFQWRGSPIRVSFNVLALIELGYQVDLLTLPVGEKKEIEGADIIRVANPFKVKNIPIGPSVPKMFFDVLLLFKGMLLCLRNKYDVVHGIEEAGFIALILARITGAKAVFEKHSDPSSHKKGKLKNTILSLYAKVEAFSIRMSDAVICTGHGLVKQVERLKTSTPISYISDIPSSLAEFSDDKASTIRADIKKSADEVLIGFVGSFASYQGVDLMFAAIPLVLSECSAARFVIIGGTEEEIAEQKSKFSALGVEDKVEFLGKISPELLVDYLRAFDILLSPRVSGVNSPLKLLDYLKVGRAIVATDIPSNCLLLSEDNAVFAQPCSDKFAEAIVSLSKDKQKRKKMGDENLALYNKLYTFKVYCEQLSLCYSNVLHNNQIINTRIPVKIGALVLLDCVDPFYLFPVIFNFLSAW